MSDLHSFLVASPLVIFASAAMIALHKAMDAADRTSSHIQTDESGSRPFLMRWNHLNAIYFPGWLGPEGLKERRRAIGWQVILAGILLAAYWYIDWVRGLSW